MTTSAVFVPGTLCDEAVFGPMLQHLAVEPIHARPIDRPNVEQAAADVLALAPGRFIAVGFSLGGFVVLELLRRAPERLTGAVLIASNPFPLKEGSEAGRRADVRLARQGGLGAVIDRFWPSYVAARHGERQDIERTVRDMAERVGVDRFEAQNELAISRPDSRATVRDTQVPLLVLCGEEDRSGPPGGCEALAGSPSARLVTLPDVGHFVPLEAPDAAAAAMSEWLQESVPCCSA